MSMQGQAGSQRNNEIEAHTRATTSITRPKGRRRGLWDWRLLEAPMATANVFAKSPSGGDEASYQIRAQWRKTIQLKAPRL